ncbi:MAG: DUF4296 domain-containing protein [Balneolaceae bacterium]|nr:DUF4296 domain-containing protein [Balneolaceae bacterium]MBO6546687.1 DUF4296 domain-containing protein [Balneolaceae bacterium]MBO6649045.1 DUF4296 domain-containing protein [Balneolaceae bacterium]
MQKWFPALLILITVVFAGCNKKELVPKPENLIPEKTYVKVITELQLLDAWIYTSEEVTNPDSIMLEMFTYYGITETQFEQSHAYYQSDPENHTARIDSALNILEKEQKRVNQSSKEDADPERR